jgi:hypothetical protein
MTRYIARDFAETSSKTTTGTTKSVVDALLFVIKNYASPDTIMAFLGVNQQVAYLLYLVLIYVIKPKLEEKAL